MALWRNHAILYFCVTRTMIRHLAHRTRVLKHVNHTKICRRINLILILVLEPMFPSCQLVRDCEQVFYFEPITRGWESWLCIGAKEHKQAREHLPFPSKRQMIQIWCEQFTGAASTLAVIAPVISLSFFLILSREWSCQMCALLTTMYSEHSGVLLVDYRSRSTSSRIYWSMN